jgi:hypothetical protein
MQHSGSDSDKRGSDTKEAIENRLPGNDSTHNSRDEKNAASGHEEIAAEFFILDSRHVSMIPCFV